MGLLVEPVEKIASLVFLFGQEDASARTWRQGVGDDPVASVAWKKHRGDYYLGRLMDRRVDLEPVKPAA